MEYQLYFFYLITFCFFKQKTAYEMRISDWSSDVCSSDLPLRSGWLRMKDGSLRQASNRPSSKPLRVTFFSQWAGMIWSVSALLRRSEIGRASCRERVCQYV